MQEVYSYPHCGHAEYRDVNAAKVILSRVNVMGGQPGSAAISYWLDSIFPK